MHRFPKKIKIRDQIISLNETHFLVFSPSNLSDHDDFLALNEDLLMQRHVGLIYAINVQRTTRRNFIFYCRVSLCKFPEIQQSVIRKDVTYSISVVSIVTRYKILVLFTFFIFLRVSKTPFYACIYFFLL